MEISLYRELDERKGYGQSWTAQLCTHTSDQSTSAYLTKNYPVVAIENIIIIIIIIIDVIILLPIYYKCKTKKKNITIKKKQVKTRP